MLRKSSCVVSFFGAELIGLCFVLFFHGGRTLTQAQCKLVSSRQIYNEDIYIHTIHTASYWDDF